MRTAAMCLSFAASALAYQVTIPSATKGWTNSGAQTLAWQRVDSDRLNFTVVLTNENRAVMPINDQVLSALVDGTLLTTTCNPPSAGWPTGGSFRVNLVQDSDSLNSILAQSSEFNISAPTTTTSLSATIKPSGTTVIAPSNTVTGANTDDTNSPTGSSNPPGTNAAPPAMSARSGLFSVLAMLGLFLA